MGIEKGVPKYPKKQVKGVISRTFHLHYRIGEIWKQGRKPSKVANDNTKKKKILIMRIKING